MNLACRCKNISIKWDRKPGDLHSRVCSCEYCQSHGAEYVSEPDSSFSFHINNPGMHRIVQHGHNTASFHECLNCGLVLATCKIGDQKYGIINVKTMGLDNCILESKPRDYSGESVAKRLQRRKENWCKVNSEQVN